MGFELTRISRSSHSNLEMTQGQSPRRFEERDVAMRTRGAGSEENKSRPRIHGLRFSAISIFRFLVSSEARHEFFLARRERIITRELIQFNNNWPKKYEKVIMTGWRLTPNQVIDPKVKELIQRPSFNPDYFLIQAERNSEPIKFEPVYKTIYTRTNSKIDWHGSKKNACLAQICEALGVGGREEDEALRPGFQKTENSQFLESSLRSYFEVKRAPKSAKYISELAERLTKQEQTNFNSVPERT